MKSIICFLVIIVCMITACKDEQPRNFILLSDFSSSRNEITAWYKETIKKSVLAKMQFTDCLIVLPIDYGSETAGNEIFRIDFAEIDFTNEFMGLQQDEFERQSLQDSIAAILPRFDQAFELAKASRIGLPAGTDLFGALRQARKYTLPDHTNIVLLMSDMLLFSDAGNMNFETQFNTASEIDHYLPRVEQIDLSNMQIVILTGAQPDIKPEKFAAVKLFWEKYIAQNNGQLLDYSSQAVSKLEELFARR